MALFCWFEDLDLSYLFVFSWKAYDVFLSFTLNPWFNILSSQSNTTNNVVRLSSDIFVIALVMTCEADLPMKESFSALF